MTQLVEESPAGAEPCEACELVRSESSRGTSTWLTGTTVVAQADVLVISGPGIAGQIVLPRDHVGSLEELAIPRRAQVLAAIRAATTTVAPKGSEPARVVASKDPPASASHLCFRVLPPDPTPQ